MDAAPPASPGAFDRARLLPCRLPMVTGRLSQGHARRGLAEGGVTIPGSRIRKGATRFGPPRPHEIRERTAMPGRASAPRSGSTPPRRRASATMDGAN